MARERLSASAIGWIMIAVLVGGVIAVTVVWSLLNPREEDEWHPTEFHAVSACEDQVDERLKAPATATYDLDARVTAADTFTVTGTVDSQNSFGAQVRTSVECTVRFEDDISYTTVERLE